MADEEGISRRDVLKVAGAIAAVGGAGYLAIEGNRKMSSQDKANPSTSELPKLTLTPTLAETEEFPQPVNYPVVKMISGETAVVIDDDNVFPTLRRDTFIPSMRSTDKDPKQHKPNNINWDEAREINGRNVENAAAISFMNLPLVIGTPPDGMYEAYWAKIPVKLKSGEETIAYFSVSSRTADNVINKGKIVDYDGKPRIDLDGTAYAPYARVTSRRLGSPSSTKRK